MGLEPTHHKITASKTAAYAIFATSAYNAPTFATPQITRELIIGADSKT